MIYIILTWEMTHTLHKTLENYYESHVSAHPSEESL